jgi:hypothetical protein
MVITNYLHKVSHLFIDTKIGKKLQDVVRIINF